MGNWQAVLLEPAKVIVAQIVQFVFGLLKVLVILLIGWLIAKLIKAVVVKVLSAVKLDTLSERIELKGLLEKGGIRYPLSELIGVVCYWLALLVTIMVAVNSAGLDTAADLLNKIVLYIPNVIAAIFILVLGMFVAALLKNIVQTAANNAGLSQVKLLGKIVEMAVVIFAAAIALEQLNIGAKIIENTITVALASLGLGFALAFGLGCKDIVGKFIQDLVDSVKK